MPEVPRNILTTLTVTVALCGLIAVLPACVDACDERLCASLVSKCLLLKSCECNMVDKANCTCCKDCHRCLSKLYTECCDCVGMCAPKNHYSYKQTLEHVSSIEELPEPIPALFAALTQEPDPEDRWSAHTYPAHLDLLYFRPPGLDNSGVPWTSVDQQQPPQHNIRHNHNPTTTTGPTPPLTDTGMNCTVAYHSQCMSLSKCRASCESMGAARYRWFHHSGCCECIGNTCLDYGKGEALCLHCPLTDNSEIEDEQGGTYYYNEYYTEEAEGVETGRYAEQANYDEEYYEEVVQEILESAPKANKNTGQLGGGGGAGMNAVGTS